MKAQTQLDALKEKIRIDIFEIFEKENLTNFCVTLRSVLIKDANRDRVAVVPFDLKTTTEDEPVVLVYEKRHKNDDGWCMLDEISSEDLVKIYDMLVEHIDFLKNTEPTKLFNPQTLPIIYAAMESARKKSAPEDNETTLREAILKFNKK